MAVRGLPLGSHTVRHPLRVGMATAGQFINCYVVGVHDSWQHERRDLLSPQASGWSSIWSTTHHAAHDAQPRRQHRTVVQQVPAGRLGVRAIAADVQHWSGQALTEHSIMMSSTGNGL